MSARISRRSYCMEVNCVIVASNTALSSFDGVDTVVLIGDFGLQIDTLALQFGDAGRVVGVLHVHRYEKSQHGNDDFEVVLHEFSEFFRL